MKPWDWERIQMAMHKPGKAARQTVDFLWAVHAGWAGRWRAFPCARWSAAWT